MNQTDRTTQLCFVSSNQRKIYEMQHLFSTHNLALTCVAYKIHEIQCLNMQEIVTDKVKKAFQYLKRPVFVEQTGLYIEDFGDLPGGLTEIIWNSLTPEKFCDYFGSRDNTNAKSITAIAYCDGKQISIFQETLQGTISKSPQGNRTHHWDCIFIPEGQTKTISSLREETNYPSIRYKTITTFLNFLKGDE